jgi:hypothetical protein
VFPNRSDLVFPNRSDLVFPNRSDLVFQNCDFVCCYYLLKCFLHQGMMSKILKKRLLFHLIRVVCS